MTNERIRVIMFLGLMAVASLVTFFSGEEPALTTIKYMYRGYVGNKYIYHQKDGEMNFAVVGTDKNGATIIANFINEGRDPFDLNHKGISTIKVCKYKLHLRDTLRIDGVLFAIIKRTLHSGRFSSTNYYYVPDKFLFDSVVGECK